MGTSVVAFDAQVMDGGIRLEDSEGESVLAKDFDAVAKFLLEDYDDEERGITYLKVCYDLNEFAEIIFRTLPKVLVDQFNEGQIKVKYQCYTIFYIPSKMLGIDGKLRQRIKGNLYQEERFETVIYHLKQFCPDTKIVPAEDAKELGMELLVQLKRMGLYPTRLVSPISIYDECVLSRMLVPRACHIPEEATEALEYSMRVMNREWRSAYKLGYWEKAFDYDVTCYSEDTECLTIDGWKLIKDLSIGEMILSFNKDKEVCQFQPVLTMQKSKYQGKMTTIDSRKVSLCVTPNHRILLKQKIRNKQSLHYKKTGKLGYKDWETLEASKLPNGNFALPVSYPVEERVDFPITDELLRLIAWVNTEGWVVCYKIKNGEKRQSGIAISQMESSEKNKLYCVEIENELKKTKIPYRHVIRERLYCRLIKCGINRISYKDQIEHNYILKIKKPSDLYLEDDIHTIPLWILQECSLRQLKIYFDILIKGDGSRKANGLYSDGTAYYTKLKINADRMMYLCHLLGYKVSFRLPSINRNTYQVAIIETKYDKRIDHYIEHIQYGGHISSIDYDGIVSCPTIEDGYLVIRHNGKSCISGNSAYPSIIAELRDIRYAKWHKSGQEEECDWGVMKGLVTINKDISPIVCDDNTLRTGTWEETITTEDAEFIRKYEIGDFKIMDGWFMNYGIKDCYPFEVAMNRLFGMRATNYFVTHISKSISVGLGGKFGEVKTDGSYGDYFNPIYRLMVTDRARLKVARFIYDKKLQDNLIGVMVDGVLADKELKLKGGTLMGNWRKNKPSPALVMSTGYQFVGDKKPGNISLEQMLTAIREHPNKTSYCGIDMAGLEYDRDFPEKPKTGGQLLENRYSSKPLKG